MNKFLLFLSLNVASNQKNLKAVLHELLNCYQIEMASSVFKRKEKNQAELNSRMELVVKGKTTETPTQLKDSIALLGGAPTLTLIAFESEVVMTPDLTLPSPLLHSDFIVLQAAKEVWPDLIHPIIKKKLVEIFLDHKAKEIAEFLFQGQRVLEEVRTHVN